MKEKLTLWSAHPDYFKKKCNNFEYNPLSYGWYLIGRSIHVFLSTILFVWENASKPVVKASDHELVKRDLDKVIELAPDFVFAYYNRGNILAALKDYRAAIVDYDRALELDPNLAEAYYNRGLTHIFLGNNRQGVQDLSKAGELGLYSAYNIIKRFTERNE